MCITYECYIAKFEWNCPTLFCYDRQPFNPETDVVSFHSTLTAGYAGPGPAAYRVTTDTVGTHPNHKKVTLKSRINSQARSGLQCAAHLLPTESPGNHNII